MPAIPARFRPVAAAALAAVAAFAILAAPLSAQAPAAAPVARLAVAAQTAPAASPGMHAAIHVHGRWTIVVRNKDGSVASRHVFENSLQLDGANLLPMVLGGFATPGSWQIVLGGPGGATGGPCGSGPSVLLAGLSGGTTNLAGSCSIVASGGNYGDQLGCVGFGSGLCSPTLSVTLLKTGTVTISSGEFGSNPLPTVALQLSGSTPVTALTTTYIDYVATLVGACNAISSAPPESAGVPGYPPTALTSSSTLTPAACSSYGGVQRLEGSTMATGANDNTAFWGFTATGLASPGIQVVPQQTVQVTVVINFS